MVNTSGEVAAARVVIVTGGSRGLGREATDRLARLGYAVVVSYAEDQQEAELVVQAVRDRNGTAVAVRANVDDDLDVERLFAETIELFGAIDAFVHVVPGSVTPASVGKIGVDEFDALCRTNQRAAFVVNQQAARHVRIGGAIIDLSNSVVTSALPRYGANAVAAAAVDAVTRVLALECAIAISRLTRCRSTSRGPPADGRAADVVAYLPGLTVRRRQGLEAEGHRQPFPVFPDCLALSVGRQGGLSGQ